MNPSNTQNDVGASHWIKAAICAVIVLLLLFFILTRSSCTQPGGPQASVEESGAGSAAESASNGDGESTETDASGEAEAPDESESSDDGKKEEVADSSETSDSSSPEGEPSVVDASSPEPDVSESSASSGSPSAASDSGGASGGQNIGGLLVKGERLGVILDVSGSMQRYLESLRSEIETRFKSPVFLEVDGCFIEPSTANPLGPAYDPRNPRLRDSVMNSIRELVLIEKVDSIYWFCDLKDKRTEEGLAELAQLARGNPGDSPSFHLYIRSTDEKPDEKLDQIIRLSQGAFEKRR